MDRATTIWPALGACALLALTSAVFSEEGQDRDPAAWEKYSEYNMPKDIYVPGDPQVLSDDNKLSGERISFLACPVLQDSDPTPLWFAYHQGERYFLRAQQNFSGLVRHPQLLHKVLVEGVISDEPRIGGGVVLNPLRLSILPEVSPECNEFRPAHDGHRVAFARRPPGPGSSGQHREAKNQAKLDRYWRLQAENWTSDGDVVYQKRTFVADYDFNSDMTWSYPIVMNAVEHARNVNASRIIVHGTRGSALLSTGETIVERKDIGQVRAEMVATIIDDYPIPRDIVSITWDTEPVPADGVNDFKNRHVRITVIPGKPGAETRGDVAAN